MLLKRTFQNHPGLEDDLYKLKNNPYLSLQNIGDKYGFSREYIRQIYNKFFNTSYGEHKNKREDDLSCSFDPRNKIHIINNDTYEYTRTNIILNFISKCRKLEFKIETSPNKKVSIVVNNFNVIVKPFVISKTVRSDKYYEWNVTKLERLNNDYFALYRNDIDNFVILPKSKLKHRPNYQRIYMLKNKSKYQIAKNKYLDFVGRFDFLRNEKLK